MTSSGTSVHKWPDRSVVHAAAEAWTARALRERPTIRAVGYIGSYARGDWSVGSDLDLIVIVRDPLPPMGARAHGWDTLEIPVPVELQLYSEQEWSALLRRSARMAQTVASEAVWLHQSTE